MIINFKIYKINQDIHKLIQIPTSIKKYIYILAVCEGGLDSPFDNRQRHKLRPKPHVKGHNITPQHYDRTFRLTSPGKLCIGPCQVDEKSTYFTKWFTEAIQFKLLSGPIQPTPDSSSLDLYVSRHVMPSTWGRL